MFLILSKPCVKCKCILLLAKKVYFRLQLVSTPSHPSYAIFYHQKYFSHYLHKQGVNPISYSLSDSVAPTGGGASEAPPKISKKESSLTPCCYVAFVCLYI